MNSGRFLAKKCIDYFRAFKSLIKPMSYMAIFAITAVKNWQIHQLEIKTTFLEGFIEGKVYIGQL